jgi:hypothetical protein
LLEANAQFFQEHHYLDLLLARPIDDWVLAQRMHDILYSNLVFPV